MSTIEVGELVYEFSLNIDEIREYGVGFRSLMTGATKTPSEGVRFDVSFDGAVSGPKINGQVQGCDHLWLRPDGRLELDIRARIKTDDNQFIALTADGISKSRNTAPGVADVRENVRLFTSSRKYMWVNKQQVWALGTIDYTKKKIEIKAYTA